MRQDEVIIQEESERVEEIRKRLLDIHYSNTKGEAGLPKTIFGDAARLIYDLHWTVKYLCNDRRKLIEEKTTIPHAEGLLVGAAFGSLTVLLIWTAF